MSDKSFGDNTNRNVVKNPLLSSAVTGLSIDELTHNAVLLPAAPTQTLATRQEPTWPQLRTVALPPHDPPNAPFGDANSNLLQSNTQTEHFSNILDSKFHIQGTETPEISSSTLSKASLKTEDEFDVNEYFARLQGTRYVSAPFSHVKEDPNSNLEATEENLEEINLNEPDKSQTEYQQSLTADIAQNFSQLPTVLPQVASAVFSSFSNMLYKSREHTPDERRHQEERVEESTVPLLGVDEKRDIAPPPRQPPTEPPTGGAANYRITTKKKAYAQIPGLSSADSHSMPLGPPQSQTVPSFFIPIAVEATDNTTDMKPEVASVAHRSETYNIFKPNDDERNLIAAPIGHEKASAMHHEVRPVLDAKLTGTPPSAAIIPPPPMFSNLPRNDNQSGGVGKAILPPSVARRISAKPPAAPTTYTSNIFVPTMPDTNKPMLEQVSAIETSQTLPPVSAGAPPSMFATTNMETSIFTPLGGPVSTQFGQMPQSHPPSNIAPIRPPTASTMVQPNIGPISRAPGTSIFVPTGSADVHTAPNIHKADPMQSQVDMKHPYIAVCPAKLIPEPTMFVPPSLADAEAESVPIYNPISSQIGVTQANLPPNLAMSANIFEASQFAQPSTAGTSISNTTMFGRSQADVKLPTSANIQPTSTHNVGQVTPLFASNVPPKLPQPTFFNPTQQPSQISANDQILNKQMVPPIQDISKIAEPIIEPPKPVGEPPKLTGGLNYRMTKKRPQYYSGPIEGVGSISNNVKPIMPPVVTQLTSSAFTPSQDVQGEQPSRIAVAEQIATPFDIIRPAEHQTAPAYSIQAPEHYTAFDLSRPTTESYEQQKEEPKGFDIFGSLKSKLSSIDVNKIQCKVTTFFDPTFNDSKKDVTGAQENVSYQPVSTSSYDQYSQGQSNFEILVPNVEVKPQIGVGAGQSNNYRMPQNYDQENQNYNVQQPYNYYLHQRHNVYPANDYYGNSQSYPHVEPNASNVPYISQPQQSTNVGADISQSGETGNKSASEEIYFGSLGGKTGTTSDPQAVTFPTNKIDAGNSGITTGVGSEAFMSPINRILGSVDMSSNRNIIENAPDYTIHEGHVKENIEDCALKGEKLIDMTQAGGDVKVSASSTGFIVGLENAPRNIGNIGETKTDLSKKSFFDNPTTNIFSSELKSDDFIKSVFSPKHYSATGSGKSEDIFKSFGVTRDLGFEQKNVESAFLSEISDITSDIKSISLDSPTNLKPGINTEHIIKETLKIKEDIPIRETNVLESLKKDVIPIVAVVSSVPLFGLSTIIADTSQAIPELNNDINVSLFEPTDTLFQQNENVSFFENIATTSLEDRKCEQISERNMCNTCRDVDKIETDEENDTEWTTQMIDNITSPVQLSNTVEVPLTETNPGMDRIDYDTTQFAEISHIAEETIDTLNVQSATDMLDDGNNVNTPRTYGWSTEETAYAASEHDYTYQLNSNSLGLFGTNPLFFEDVPNNASDEIKAEYKNSQEDLLPKQMTAPSAAPAEEDLKSDETGGLDVHSIEQDAKEDFPIFEEFVIDPSETDDNKIEYKEREKTSESSMTDTFTNRIERFKKMEETTADPAEEAYAYKSFQFDLPPTYSPAISIASYFDTGNYAVETHYRNSISSPTGLTGFSVGSPNMPLRIPPGFEEEFQRRLSEVSSQYTLQPSTDFSDVPSIPETSTQTNITNTTTFTNPTQTTEIKREISTAIGQESIPSTQQPGPFDTQQLPDISKMGAKRELTEDISATREDNLQASEVADGLTEKILKPEAESASNQTLPDPMKFFASNEPITTQSDTTNRLASYFSMPPPKPDHSKSFFELSQSQNHYRHELHANKFDIPQEKYVANLKLIKDLTSLDNFEVSKDQIVRTVNYFTVKYDMTTELNIGEPGDQKVDGKHPPDTGLGEIDDAVIESTFNKCIYCCNIIHKDGVSFGNYKVKKTSDSSDSSKERSNMDQSKETNKRTVTVNFENFSLDGENNDEITVVNESRPIIEYVPVNHHWFYRVDVEDKSIWRGFSVADSTALEDAFLSPDLTDDTVVPTDGGRYDVNVKGRIRMPVYWCDKPTNVRRCSWFYKGTTDARFVPYREDVAGILEEEYRHGLTTGEWHRRLVLPDNELVVMHGPSVMVHFLHGGSTDAFSGPSQSSARPRVVRRGCDESEIEDPSPSSIDHLLLLCHGVGSACDMRFRSVEEVVEDFRATSFQLLQSHYRNSYDNGAVSRVEVLPISWHATLHSGETGVDRRLEQLTLDSIPRLRNFTNDTVLDVLFYTSPVFCQTIIDTVCNEMNRIYSLFRRRNPHFTGGVSLGGHSLGSVILYDLLCHQVPERPLGVCKTYVSGSAGTGPACVRYPTLAFAPDALYALGSPIAIFECIRGVESLGRNFALPTCKNFFNIFHPYDPIAYRIEPLINPQLRDVKPFLIPHHKGRKRMHLELKDTMARVGADLKQKLMESLKVTWNKWKSQPQTAPPDGHLEKVVEEEMEKQSLCDEVKEELGQNDTVSPEMLGNLNAGRRVDYVLQEAPLEMINEYLFAMSSHVGYWESEDTMLLMLREIYDALGVQPDCTVPQQTLTVQRTRLTKDEKIYVGTPGADDPSTSQGGT